ncbi:Hypothetical predicted protein [Pelobates cultripes]|uniref:Uncharacterized protein n=1 Tax=Pelobates cultripes TaxID=61616 RepID=A0AAD1TJ64_PELCU|nr:Hypothetical predicted protein [Pelobates cultripes]
MFRPQQEQRQPSCHQQAEGTCTDSDGSEYTKAPGAPLTLHDMQTMLRAAIADIKSYMATELDKKLSGLREDIESLTNKADHTKTHIKDLTTTSQAHTQDITYLHAKIEALEESLEDLNNRSRRNNIRNQGLPESVTAEGLHTTLTGLLKAALPKATAQDLLIDPRDVIVRLHFFAVKEKILTITRSTPPQHQGIRLAFYQDLAPSTLKKHRDLKQRTLNQQGTCGATHLN